MAAIIGIHSIETVWPALPSRAYLEFILVQPLKFGTIAFFLIAGFLFGERAHQYRPREYFVRRLRTVFVPWTLWVACDCVLRLVHAAAAGRLAADGTGLLVYESGLLFNTVFESPFWFVPNLLLALAILLMFRRVLMDWRTGCFFLLGSLFYAANIYGHWVNVRHNRAVFGFIFYLWLGAWAAWHFADLKRWIARIPASVMAVFVLLAGLGALAEGRLLERMGSVDPVNSLRLTNQIFSVAVTLALLKARRPLWPRVINVRAHTFGIYLCHVPVLAFLGTVVVSPHRLAEVAVPGNSAAWSILAIVMTFTLAYGTCLMIVRGLLAVPGLRWTVGVARKNQAAIGAGHSDRARAGELFPAEATATGESGAWRRLGLSAGASRTGHKSAASPATRSAAASEREISIPTAAGRGVAPAGTGG